MLAMIPYAQSAPAVAMTHPTMTGPTISPAFSPHHDECGRPR